MKLHLSNKFLIIIFLTVIAIVILLLINSGLYDSKINNSNTLSTDTENISPNENEYNAKLNELMSDIYPEYIILDYCDLGDEDLYIVDSEGIVRIVGFIYPYGDSGAFLGEYLRDIEYEKEFNETVKDFRDFMGKLIVSEEDVEIEEIIVKELINKNYTISTAESVTGGMIASTIINVNGSSEVIKESYVTYSNEVKNKLLNVSFDTINKYDVVSEEVVKEMALGLYGLTKSEVCISVSGYAGPGDNMGKVCYAIKVNNYLKTYTGSFRGNRNLIRLRAVRRILYDLHIIFKEKMYE